MMTSLRQVLMVPLLILTSTLTVAQKWEIADAVLLTPWAEEVDPDNVLQEYPRPMIERSEWLNLNGIWQFKEALEGERPPVGKNLKGTILVPFPWESALSGVRKQFDSRRAWYRRTFILPEAWKGDKILLHFGAVDWESKVYVNGTCVGTHKGGYDPFHFDITNYLTNKGDQELIVEVWDPGNDLAIATGKQNNERFNDPQRYAYAPASGIWQTVWLEPVPDLYIKDIRSIPDIDRKEVKVLVTLSELGSHELEIFIKDGDRLVGVKNGLQNQEIIVEIEDPVLWTPENPFLYDLEVRLVGLDRSNDFVNSYFGMRKISLKQEHDMQRICLNNKYIFQMGPLDQGYWPDGLYTAPSDDALKWEIEMMKEFGYNMVRKHIKVEPQRWYYWADKLGLLVWQDMPGTFKVRDEGEKSQFELELQRMIKTHWNHPSIVNWIVFNEHWGVYDVERLTNMVMEIDPTRLVTGNTGIDAGKPSVDYEVGHIKSNHSYRPPNVALMSNKRAVVCGEYGAIGYNIEGHIWDTDGPWVHNNYDGKDAATAEYERFNSMILDFRRKGLCAAVYTQWTDVENEMNGIYTYDRKVIKHHKERIKEANRKVIYSDIPLEVK
jgi:beta-galactosidase/beta-glucuronidase